MSWDCSGPWLLDVPSERPKSDVPVGPCWWLVPEQEPTGNQPGTHWVFLTPGKQLGALEKPVRKGKAKKGRGTQGLGPTSLRRKSAEAARALIFRSLSCILAPTNHHMASSGDSDRGSTVVVSPPAPHTQHCLLSAAPLHSPQARTPPVYPLLPTATPPIQAILPLTTAPVFLGSLLPSSTHSPLPSS